VYTSLIDNRLTEIHTAEPLVPDPSPFEVEIAIEKLEIPTELIQAGGEILRTEIRKLINSIWNKDELPVQWKESITVPVHKNGDKTDYSNVTCMR
jgi:hypothetical protein